MRGRSAAEKGEEKGGLNAIRSTMTPSEDRCCGLQLADARGRRGTKARATCMTPHLHAVNHESMEKNEGWLLKEKWLYWGLIYESYDDCGMKEDAIKDLAK